MIIAYCSKCKDHERVEIDNEFYSRCNKENCLSIYSNCIRVTAVNNFISQKNQSTKEKSSTALEICYPSA